MMLQKGTTLNKPLYTSCLSVSESAFKTLSKESAFAEWNTHYYILYYIIIMGHYWWVYIQVIVPSFCEHWVINVEIIQNQGEFC